MASLNPTLKVVSEHIDALTFNVAHLTAENASLVRVFEVAMKLVANNDWSPANREALVLAVKECNHAPVTAKAISEREATGMDLFRGELEKLVSEGVADVYLPGINMCLGMVAAAAFRHRINAEKI
ncbi:hypothetical protein [Nissabacter sp. SGAir0207]|uniref:hypothetical protein n=1 Tax=Nissabacter sp. SGAir0207 TaxID=2126321 RepID=UPI0010CCDB00|nr:hypothetical protein [Nissabacter sp. SGAir0207]QCR38787.1 hypothetical protein C1N62_21935 [Nissabacter sp. SGAir0207]